MTRRGYLSGIRNPHFSGIATLVFRSTKKVTKRTTYTTCHCEAGYGVRQLAYALTANGRFDKASGEIKLAYTVDDTSMLTSFEIVS